VFIYQNGTLSNVYNTLGTELTKKDVNYSKNDTLFTIENEVFKRRNYIQIDDDGWIKDYSDHYDTDHPSMLNSKGVCRFNYNVKDDNTILGVKFKISEEVQDYLRTELGIRGLFFVRQKCVPTILA
jgi:hypothetical protein